jgi:hypothetical protein
MVDPAVNLLCSRDLDVILIDIKDNAYSPNCRDTSLPTQEIGPYVAEETDEDNDMNYSPVRR